MKKRRALILLSLLVAALMATVVQAGSSTHYAIRWDVVARGGSAMSSAHYAIQSTASQTAIGPATSGSYRLGAGYWYGIGAGFAIYLPLVIKNFDL